ncbi:MAG: LrgB family protein [Pseudomonadota bacterium]
MKAFAANPVFGVLISLAAYEVGLWINRKTKKALFNPLLLAIAMVIGILRIFDISLEDYNKGGQLISFLLAPATVALAVPLYKNISLLKKNAVPIIVGIFTGSVTSVASILLLSRASGLDRTIALSLAAKSVTTPIGIEITRLLGGIPEITVVSIIITGITGAITSPWLCRTLGIKDKVAVGIAIGTASHAVGTSKAIELGEVEGAMSGLAIGVAGLTTVIITPVLVSIFQYFSIL